MTNIPTKNRLLLLILFLISIFYLDSYFQSHCIDDAGITFQYSKNLSNGIGLRYHQNFQAVEGYSNPFWTFLLASFHKVGFLNLVVVSKKLSILFLFLSGLVFYFQSKKNLYFSFLFFIFLLNPMNTYWSFSGLENASFQFFLFYAFILVSQNNQKQLYLALSLLILSRPESIIYALLISFYSKEKKKNLTCSAIIFFSYLIFRLIYFNDILPNTIWAKLGTIHSMNIGQNLQTGWSYWYHYFDQYLCTGWLGLFVLFYPLYHKKYLLFSLILSHFLFILLSGGDWMRDYRFMMPISPLYFYILIQFLSKLNIPYKYLSYNLLLILLIYIQWLPKYKYLNKPYMELSVRIQRGKKIEKYAKQYNIKNPSLLDPDIGGTAYGTNLIIFDLVGLTNKEIGKSYKTPADFRKFIIQSSPDFIYSTSYWTKISKMKKIKEIYQNYVPLEGNHYFDDLDSCLLIKKKHRYPIK